MSLTLLIPFQFFLFCFIKSHTKPREVLKIAPFTAVDTDNEKHHRFEQRWSETANLFQGLKFPPQQARIKNTWNRKISGLGCIPDMFLRILIVCFLFPLTINGHLWIYAEKHVVLKGPIPPPKSNSPAGSSACLITRFFTLDVLSVAIWDHQANV